MASFLSLEKFKVDAGSKRARSMLMVLAMLLWNPPGENSRAASSQIPSGRTETRRPLHLHPRRYARSQPGIMACITSDVAAGPHLLEQAVLLATELDAELIAVHVESPRDPESERDQTNRNLTLFSRAGVKVVRLAGSDAADCLLKFARAHELKRILVSKDRQSFLRSLFGCDLWRKMVRKGQGLHIQIVDLGVHATTSRPFSRA
jgi:K+-sensing histidine kinase KdpD